MVSFGRDKSSSQPGSVWDQQAPYLQSLYAGLLSLANAQTGGGLPGIVPGAGQPGGGPAPYGGLSPRRGRSMGEWRRGLEASRPTIQPLPGGQPQTQGFVNPMSSPIGQFAGGLSQSLLSGQNPWVQGQIANLGQNLGNFWNQQLLPGIANSFSYYGSGGGARESVAQGMGAQGLLEQFQQGANNIYAQSLQNAPQLYNLGMAPWAAQWLPFQQLAGLLGSPTVLGGGSTGRGFDIGLANPFGGGGGGGGGGGTVG